MPNENPQSAPVTPNVVKRPKVLFSWTAPERPFKRRSREFWVSIGAIASIGGLILFLIEGPISVILIISLIFLFYMLSTVEPQEIKYEITDQTINIANTQNDMNMFTRYWFGQRYGSDLLVLEALSVPGRLELVIHEKDKEEISKTLNTYLVHEEATPDNLDKAAEWFSKKIPGNN